MTLFLLHTFTTAQFTKLTTSCAITISCTSSKPPHQKPNQHQQVPPARDRIIDFGRHKGKPLGSLPSSYLKWVCRNLRAGDSLHWAELADQVLHDPVYKDRIEWELAENLLTGNVNRNSSESVVSRLVDVSERFGWDNEDKVGWSKVDFQLLGTSHGGRIPRKGEGRMGKQELKMVEEEERMVELSDSEERRRQRRMRRIRGKMGISDNVRGSFGNGEKTGGGQDPTVENNNSEERRLSMVRDKMGIRDNSRGSFGIGEKSDHEDPTVEIKSGGRMMMRRVRDKMGNRDDVKGSFGNGKRSGGDDGDQDRTVQIKSPFPGREALLKKVLSSRRFL